VYAVHVWSCGGLLRNRLPLAVYVHTATRIGIGPALRSGPSVDEHRVVRLRQPPALGRRGEGWVVVQSIVILGAAVCAGLGPRWPDGGEPWLRVIGLVLEAAGVGMFLASRITLGRSFTPLPRPRECSTLRSTGIYARARHPVYGGVLIAGVGLSLHRSPLVLVPTAVLAVIFWLKSIREEVWLCERYPGYPAYRQATPHRFIPWIV
jgi:protein-S-isoprenylcysteine O-methyltransferase Ste14